MKYYGMTAVGDTAALREVIDSGALYTAQVCYNLLNPSAGRPVPVAFPTKISASSSTARLPNVWAALVSACWRLAHCPASWSVTRLPCPASPRLARGWITRPMCSWRRRHFLTAEGYADSLVEASMRLPGASRRCRPSWLAILASNISSKPLGQRREGRCLPPPCGAWNRPGLRSRRREFDCTRHA